MINKIIIVSQKDDYSLKLRSTVQKSDQLLISQPIQAENAILIQLA